jgi:hypothetical protein
LFFFSLFNLPKKVDLLLSLVTTLITRSYGDLENIAVAFCEEFDIDPAFVMGLIAIAKRDFSKISQFAQRFGSCDPVIIDKFVSLLSHLGMLTTMKPNEVANKLIQKAKTGAQELGKAALTEAKQFAVDVGKLTYKELFQLADTDKSGSLSFDEFMDLLRYMNLPLSQNVALRIYSEVQRFDGTIGQDEFEKAMNLLETRVADRVLTALDLSTQHLVYVFSILVLILLLLFAFIFLGISAFTGLFSLLFFRPPFLCSLSLLRRWNLRKHSELVDSD